MSMHMNHAPFCASEMVLFIIGFVSNKLAAGEPASSLYVNLSPPTVICTLYGSSFRGQKSHTNVAYVTYCCGGTSSLVMNSMVSVLLTLYMLPWARRPH